MTGNSTIDSFQQNINKSDTLTFGPAINQNDLVYTQNGLDLTILNIKTKGSITLAGYLDEESVDDSNVLTGISFSNGSSLTYAQLCLLSAPLTDFSEITNLDNPTLIKMLFTAATDETPDLEAFYVDEKLFKTNLESYLKAKYGSRNYSNMSPSDLATLTSFANSIPKYSSYFSTGTALDHLKDYVQQLPYTLYMDSLSSSQISVPGTEPLRLYYEAGMGAVVLDLNNVSPKRGNLHLEGILGGDVVFKEDVNSSTLTIYTGHSGDIIKILNYNKTDFQLTAFVETPLSSDETSTTTTISDSLNVNPRHETSYTSSSQPYYWDISSSPSQEPPSIDFIASSSLILNNAAILASNNQSIVFMPEGVSLSDVLMARNMSTAEEHSLGLSNALKLDLGLKGTIFLNHYFEMGQSSYKSSLQGLQFKDGSFLKLTDQTIFVFSKEKAFFNGTAPVEFIYSTITTPAANSSYIIPTYGHYIVDLGPSQYSTTIDAPAGNISITYNEGYGPLYIHAPANAYLNINLGSNLTQNQIEFTVDSNGLLQLVDKLNPINSITLLNAATPINNWSIQFNDGALLNVCDAPLTWHTSDTNNIFYSSYVSGETQTIQFLIKTPQYTSSTGNSISLTRPIDIICDENTPYNGTILYSNSVTTMRVKMCPGSNSLELVQDNSISRIDLLDVSVSMSADSGSFAIKEADPNTFGTLTITDSYGRLFIDQYGNIAHESNPLASISANFGQFSEIKVAQLENASTLTELDLTFVVNTLSLVARATHTAIHTDISDMANFSDIKILSGLNNNQAFFIRHNSETDQPLVQLINSKTEEVIYQFSEFTLENGIFSLSGDISTEGSISVSSTSPDSYTITTQSNNGVKKSITYDLLKTTEFIQNADGSSCTTITKTDASWFSTLSVDALGNSVYERHGKPGSDYPGYTKIVKNKDGFSEDYFKDIYDNSWDTIQKSDGYYSSKTTYSDGSYSAMTQQNGYYTSTDASSFGSVVQYSNTAIGSSFSYQMADGTKGTSYNATNVRTDFEYSFRWWGDYTFGTSAMSPLSNLVATASVGLTSGTFDASTSAIDYSRATHLNINPICWTVTSQSYANSAGNFSSNSFSTDVLGNYYAYLTNSSNWTSDAGTLQGNLTFSDLSVQHEVSEDGAQHLRVDKDGFGYVDMTKNLDNSGYFTEQLSNGDFEEGTVDSDGTMHIQTQSQNSTILSTVHADGSAIVDAQFSDGVHQIETQSADGSFKLFSYSVDGSVKGHVYEYNGGESCEYFVDEKANHDKIVYFGAEYNRVANTKMSFNDQRNNIEINGNIVDIVNLCEEAKIQFTRTLDGQCNAAKQSLQFEQTAANDLAITLQQSISDFIIKTSSGGSLDIVNAINSAAIPNIVLPDGTILNKQDLENKLSQATDSSKPIKLFG